MSGDVQPRKRKDKKRKRDSIDHKSEAEISFSRKASLHTTEEEDEGIHHGVHDTKMGSDDVHLHIQSEHGTGGHWCAKIFFFSLLAILIGLIGLIIMENRGLSDLDTPLSESRYSNYFEGWVDEHRDSHDHDPHEVVAHEIEEHEEHDEPFEEEEDVSEPEEEHDDEHDDEHDEEHDDAENEDDDDQVAEDEDDEDAAEVDEKKDDSTREENATQEDDVTQEEEEEVNQPIYTRVRRGAPSKEASIEVKTIEETKETNIDNENEDEEDEGHNEEDENEPFDESVTKKEDLKINHVKNLQELNSFSNNSEKSNEVILNENEKIMNLEERTSKESKTVIKEDYDGTYETVIDNDAEELKHLREKAKQAEQESDNAEPEEEESYSSPLAVKILVGFALAIVARVVLIKNGNVDDKAKTSTSKDEVSEEVLMKRRLTVASPKMLDDDEGVEELDEELIEEEIEEIEEEVEEIEEVQEVKNETVTPEKLTYRPETFEELNAMYKSKPPAAVQKPSSSIEKPKAVEIKTVSLSSKTQQNPIPKQFEKEEQMSEPKKQPIPQTAVKEEKLTKIPIKYDRDDYTEEEDIGEVLDEEELYEEEELGSEEEELSEIDDDDLMKRLEEKYGKLPDTSEVYDSEEENIEIDNSWTKIKPRPGGGPQAFETEDEYIEEQLRRANRHMLQDNIDNALKIYESLILKYPDSHGALLGKAVALDKLSEKQKSNIKLNDAIIAYKKYLAFGDDIQDDSIYRKTAERCIERMRFLGLVSQTIVIHKELIERFKSDSKLQNDLAVTYLLNNQLQEAKSVLHNILIRWPNDGFAKVHYGFVLKNLDYDLENAVRYLKDGIDSNEDGTQDGRFYFNLGEALQRLNRSDEAMEIFRKGAKRNLFPSEYQRSLYNVNNLRAKPFWLKKEFPNEYQEFFSMLERNWRQIREEGINALNEKNYFINEAENLKDKGDWKQFELFAQGIKKLKNCEKARVTCALIETFSFARYCKRGQTKFSIMDPGTHVWPHCGPTNCRLRAHLGLKIPSGTKIRVAKDAKTWEEGKFLIFDDSFEHEVWHNGTSPRLVLIIDVWHPDLSESERTSLSAI